MANKTSKGQEGYYASYKAGNKHAKNRKIKLERLLKQQPNNEQIKTALKDIHYRRKTPNTSMWGHREIALAKILKEFTGNFNYNILNSNAKVAAEALQTLPTKNANFKLPANQQNSIANKAMFSLAARAKNKGTYVYAGV